MSGDNVIIDDFVVFAAINVGSDFNNQERNTMIAKHSKVDGTVAFHKEYKHSMHGTCVGISSKQGIQTVGRDSYRSIFVGQPTCLDSRIGSFVLKVSSTTGEFLRAKMLSFATQEFRAEKMIEVDEENNVHVIMGRLTYFVLVKLANDLTVTSIRTRTRTGGFSWASGNQIHLAKG